MNILLNCFPPASIQYPSISLSVLKSFMTIHGCHVNVKYWNRILNNFQMRFLEKKGKYIDDDIFGNLLPFINYLWVRSGKNLDKSSLRYILLSMNPLWYNLEFDYTEKKMNQYAIELEQIITSEILKMDLDKFEIFGITARYSQWICGGIFAQKVKELYPKIKIVIGGLGTSDEAMAMMNNFKYYDYAIWGEGEYPLLYLCKAIESCDLEVPCSIYRDKNGIPKISQSKKKDYFDLNSEIFPDYSDFFDKNDKIPSDVYLPFEGNRGCHWNKCRFCYLNDGYRYRFKNNEIKIKELKHQIEKYHILNFSFVDCDVIGKDINMFEDFLDKLIKLKEEYVDLSFVWAEVITKNINSAIIKKMLLGGIYHVIIGYESPSNQLLRKINKKNTFASNLLFIKWAKEFSITIGGLNIIQGLLEETTEDIREATDNLYHLRFFLSHKAIKHGTYRLKITKSSPYYPDIEKNNDLASWSISSLLELFPDNYWHHADKYCLFEYNNNHLDAGQWEFFYKVEEHFLKSKYNYQIINHSGAFHYREYLNDTLINELVFEDTIHWEVLKLCNHQVISLTEICAVLSSSSQNDIISVIKTLKNEGLLYHNNDFSEIVTPVNTDVVL